MERDPLPPLDCRAHGDDVRRLARGELSPARGTLAEQAATGCPDCARWWAASLSGDQEVVEGVREGALAFAATPRRQPISILPWAAMLLLGLGVGWSLADRSADPTSEAPRVAVEESRPTAEDEPIFSAGFETGNLDEWRQVAAGS